jgi:predicted DNA-binding transcriptional regulator YafY
LPSRRTTEDMLEMLQYLRDHPGLHKITELAKRYKTDRTVIDRWCKYLQKRYGVIIEKTNSDFVDKSDTANYIPRGFIRLSNESPEILNISLTTIELDALMVIAERIKPLTPLVKQAIGKLASAQRIKNYKESKSVLHTPLYDEYATDPSEVFERIIKAIREQQVAKLKYTNAKGETKAYRFNSYALLPHERHLHLVGVSHSSLEAGFETVIRLRLDQIGEFKLTLDHFDDPSFDVVAYASSGFGASNSDGKPQAIKVQFSAEKAQYIRRTKRHETQEVETNKKDGSVVWQIHAPISEDLVHWVVSYGPHARVIAPKELKKAVVEWAKGSVSANG